MNPTESMLVLGIAALATAIAVGAMTVPEVLLNSSISQAFMLVIALILFSYSPVVGISALTLFAIIMFHRNVRKTIQYSETLNGMKKYITPVDMEDVGGFDAMQHDQRDLQKFQDRYEAYQSEGVVQEPVQKEDGMYPERSMETREDVRTDTFMYRPGPDMGDNTFEPVGASINEKYAAIQY